MNTALKKVLLGTAAFTVAAAGLYGCADFLENNAVPQGTLDGGVLQTKSGVEGSLLATYRALDWTTGVGGNFGSAASNWVWGSVPSDDAYKGSEATDAPEVTEIESYLWGNSGANSYLNDKWRAVYEGVNRSNATLRLLAEVRAAKPGEISDADAAGIEGEALFLRAHFHFEAWRIWGAIPYYKEDDTDFRKANLAATAVPAEIMADLNAAIGLLGPTPRNGNKGRATAWTARAYKGRLEVYTEQWAAALTTLRDIRTNGPFALEASFDRVWTGFQAAENGPETVFAYQASRNDGEPNGNNANYGERLNFPHSGSPFGCCGFHQPSQNLINFMAVDATGLPLSLSNPSWNASDGPMLAGSPIAIDPRLDWVSGRDGVPYKDWGTHDASWIRAPAYGGRYSPKKNVHERASGAQSTVGWVNTQLNSVNIHILRYADVLLLLAEAEVEAGVLENARTIINEIRTRAGVTAQGCGFTGDANNNVDEMYAQCANDARIAVPLNDASITWATYRVGTYPAPFASQAAAREAVRAERRVELALEGQRFFDLRRWGIAEATLNAYLTAERARRPYLVGASDYQARHRWFPIPSIQIELSKVDGTPRLTQNTGW